VSDQNLIIFGVQGLEINVNINMFKGILAALFDGKLEHISEETIKKCNCFTPIIIHTSLNLETLRKRFIVTYRENNKYIYGFVGIGKTDFRWYFDPTRYTLVRSVESKKLSPVPTRKLDESMGKTLIPIYIGSKVKPEEMVIDFYGFWIGELPNDEFE